MRYFVIMALTISSMGCGSLFKSDTLNEPEIYLKPTRDATELVVIDTPNGSQVLDIMQRFLKPRQYSETAATESAPGCEYIYVKNAQSPTDLGSCNKLIQPTCFQLKETIRHSIWSKQEVEMVSRICVGRSRLRQQILMEVVYGDTKKWSGTNVSTNAQKEFHELKDELVRKLGEANVQYVKKLGASKALKFGN
jgi:hypothetical protein